MGLPEDFFGGVAQDDIMHTPTLPVPLNVGMGGGFPWIMTNNLQIMTQLYQNLENSRNFFCSPRATDVCT